MFDILFRTPPRLRDLVLASRALPLPPVPVAAPPKPPPPPAPDLAAIEREERRGIEQMLTQLRQDVVQLGSRYDAMAAEMRQAAVELAIAVAGHVVFDKLQAGDFPIEEMVRQAVARLPAAPAVTVCLHPEDLAMLQRRLSRQGDKETRRQGDKETESPSVSLSPCLPVSLSGKTEPRFEADSSLPRGGCRAEAGEIHVLADLGAQLDELRRQLLWSASHARSGPDPSAA